MKKHFYENMNLRFWLRLKRATRLALIFAGHSTGAQPGIFEDRRGFFKLKHKLLAVLKAKVLKCASFSYNFTIKRTPSSLNIFTRKNKRCYVYLLIPYNWPSLSRDHQTVTIMNHCCYSSDGQKYSIVFKCFG